MSIGMTESPNMAPQLLSREEAMQALGVSMSTVDGMIRRGELQSLKLGSRVLIEPAALQEFIASRRAKKPS